MANDMFKELGYEYNYDDGYEEYTKTTKRGSITISFYDKELIIHNDKINPDGTKNTMVVLSNPEIKAISQKLLEKRAL